MQKPSCSYKILHQNRIGMVYLCTKCRNLKVEIGTILALVSRKSFRLILADFKDRQSFIHGNREVFHTDEKMYICLNKQNLFLSLTANEMDDVIDLFEVSNHMLAVEEIIREEL